MDIVEKARIFATAAHAAVGQVRKYTGDAYIVHPTAVAKIVAMVPHTKAMLAAAYLHDVVEDTKITSPMITAEFGTEIGELVYWLTDQSKPTDGNRETRKAIDRAHSGAAPAAAQTIKLADIIDNTDTIEARDPDFAKVFRHEKRRLLAVMNKGDATLMQRAIQQIAEHEVAA